MTTRSQTSKELLQYAKLQYSFLSLPFLPSNTVEMTPTPLTPQINVASRPARQSVTTTTLVSGRRRVNAYLGEDIAKE